MALLLRSYAWRVFESIRIFPYVFIRIRRFFGIRRDLDELIVKFSALDSWAEGFENRIQAMEEKVAWLEGVADGMDARFEATRGECPQAKALDDALKEIQWEWEKWYNKFRSLWATINRREARETAAEDTSSPPMNPAARALLERGTNGLLRSG